MSRFLCSLLLFVWFYPATLFASEKISVFVSIPPQAYLVKRIAGQVAEVEVLLKPGGSAETFDPSLKQMKRLNSADIYFPINAAFEGKWFKSIAQNNTRLKIANCCDDFFAEASLNLDKHVWVSPRNAQILAGRMTQELTKLRPAQAPFFKRNYLQLLEDLEQLDNEIYTLLENRRTDFFVISHASLGHFANDFGLSQLALEHQGREPGIRELKNIIEQVRKENINTLFIQAQHRTATALAFSRETGARMIELDPLKADYIHNIRYIAEQLAEAMN